MAPVFMQKCLGVCARKQKEEVKEDVPEAEVAEGTVVEKKDVEVEVEKKDEEAATEKVEVEVDADKEGAEEKKEEAVEGEEAPVEEKKEEEAKEE
jgi:hypothetical protein